MISGSWIQLESKQGDSVQNSPKYSDDEEMEEVLADAQTDVDRSATKLKETSDSISAVSLKNNNDPPVAKYIPPELYCLTTSLS